MRMIKTEDVCEMLDIIADSKAIKTKHGAIAIAKTALDDIPTIDPESLLPQGKWILEAHDERVNYRWNVSAECSNCSDKKVEIWAGFFPDFPTNVAKTIALVSAKSIDLPKYCQNCGAKMKKDGDLE